MRHPVVRFAPLIICVKQWSVLKQEVGITIPAGISTKRYYIFFQFLQNVVTGVAKQDTSKRSAQASQERDRRRN